MKIRRFEYDLEFGDYVWITYYIHDEEWRLDEVFKSEYFKRFRRELYDKVISMDLEEYGDCIDLYYWLEGEDGFRGRLLSDYIHERIGKKLYILCDDYLEKLLHELHVLIDL